MKNISLGTHFQGLNRQFSFLGLLDKFGGAAAGYSLRKLAKDAVNAVRVRRSSDNTETDIGFTKKGELDTTTLLDFVNARDVAPADYGGGAAAAYSLRYVSDSYTGDVVRVRRSVDNAEADFNPTEITDGTLLAWVGNTASDNGYVTTWYDQSGNSNDATQGTAANQPKIVDAGVLVEENGKPSISFDYVDDYFSITLITQTSEFSHFVTSKGTGFLYGSGTGGTDYFSYSNNIRISINGTLLTESTNVNNLQTQTSFIRSNTDLTTIYYNSNTGASSTISGGFISNTIGGYSNGLLLWNGNIQEHIIYSTDQSSNRGNIEANVNDYYSIYTSTNDGFVTTWYDQAGSNDATQATAAAQPQIVDGGSLITENGKPAIHFGYDGSTSTQLINTTVAKSGDINTAIFSVHKSIAGTGNYIYDGFNSPDYFGHNNVSRGVNFNYSSNLPSNVYQLITRLGEIGGLLSVYKNGLLYDSGDGGIVGDNGITIGTTRSGTVYQNNKQQELILYPSDQSGNRTAIEGNINKNYQVYWDGAGYSLLDNFAGAEAAYALVPLSSTYRGAIVKVRRASNNAELDIYANYDGTLDTASLLDFCSGTDGYVSVWYDQSGNGNNAVQSTAASQPQIVSGGSLITSNGYTVIQYDGTDDNLTTSLTATGTMLMGGSDGSAFYEVAISGSYSLLKSAANTDHPLNESIRVIWSSSLTTAQKTAIEAAVTYTDWDFSDVTNFFKYWREKSELTDFPLIDTSSGTNFGQAWYICSSLTSFPLLDVSSGTNFLNAWVNCSSLTSFPTLDVSSGTNFGYAWYGCNSLTSFPQLDLSNGTNFNSAWYVCSSLTSFPALDVSSGTNFSYAWGGCSSLQDFPANMFDSVTAIDFTFAFASTNLTQTSIDNILTSIDTANTSNGTFFQSGGSAPSATGEAAIDNLISRGWTITVTGGYQTYAGYKYRVETDGGTLYASRACTETAINDLKAL